MKLMNIENGNIRQTQFGKISRSIGILHKLKIYFPWSVLKTLYRSIIPQLNFTTYTYNKLMN